MTKAFIELIEELAANAWRPEIEQTLDGWRLRYNQGVNRRGNSVWPNGWGQQLGLDERLEMVEAFYRRWGVRARYQMCPAALPENLAEVLLARGYRDDAHTAVQTAALNEVISRTATSPNHQIEISPSLSEDWFALYQGAEKFDDHGAAMRRGTLQRIGSRAGFARLKMDGNAAAVGLGVYERGWVGIFCMATQDDFRRQGAATSILHALVKWGGDLGAENVYLQVMENNPPALALYQRAGFTSLYQYYYAEKELG